MAKAVMENVGNDNVAGRVKGFGNRTKGFLGEVRNEMRKVSSPSRKEVQATTAVVIVTVFIFGAYFWAVDSVIGRSLDWAFRTLVRH